MVINDGQPEYCVQRAMAILNRFQKALSGSKILLLGVSYKQNIDDCRESPALRLRKELLAKGAQVDYYDPWVASFADESGSEQKGVEELKAEVIEEYDLIVIGAAHTNVDYDYVQRHAKFIFDTKNVMNNIKERENIEVL